MVIILELFAKNLLLMTLIERNETNTLGKNIYKRRWKLVVIFSDESKFNIFGYDRRGRVLKSTNTEFERKMFKLEDL